PVLDGYAAFWEIRELKPAPGVVFVSVENTPDVVKNVISNGALDFLVKPFKREDVVARVKRALARPRA
ncbi:MAG: response regulator, partial [Spirochaetia bacterium]|nr:response regulator [Spirochaetia bacterium]